MALDVSAVCILLLGEEFLRAGGTTDGAGVGVCIPRLLEVFPHVRLVQSGDVLLEQRPAEGAEELVVALLHVLQPERVGRVPRETQVAASALSVSLALLSHTGFF